MKDEQSVIGIYHKGCTDGTVAAAVLLKKFPHARLFPLSHNYEPEDIAPVKELARGGEIYFLDCAIGVREFFDLECASLTVLDHHIGVKDELDALHADGKIFYVFNNEQSGASIAWQYFFPDEPMPRAVAYAEDYDLWRWALGDDTKHAVNYLYIFTDRPADMIRFLDEVAVPEALEKGAAISEYTDFSIAKITGRAKPLYMRIGEWTLPAYNIGEYQPYVGMNIAERENCVAILFSIRGEKVVFSIRSLSHHTPSALDVAQALGGGGHRNATGAQISLREFVSMLVL